MHDWVCSQDREYDMALYLRLHRAWSRSHLVVATQGEKEERAYPLYTRSPSPPELCSIYILGPTQPHLTQNPACPEPGVKMPSLIHKW
jgi:hypothetical protein